MRRKKKARLYWQSKNTKKLHAKRKEAGILKGLKDLKDGLGLDRRAAVLEAIIAREERRLKLILGDCYGRPSNPDYCNVA